jgi:hypothetical protein
MRELSDGMHWGGASRGRAVDNDGQGVQGSSYLLGAQAACSTLVHDDDERDWKVEKRYCEVIVVT